ncbi:MAG: elongation factor-1 alpha, partial [Proteobacteria bacterium]|nr:elongation factor-1 alpha [Pseudomonadota bacterium]
MSNGRKNAEMRINLPSLNVSLRVLFSAYLIVASVGLMVAGLQIMMTHGMADGKFGLSVDDIVYSYYGNRENSKLEIKLSGSMKDKADSHERAEIIKWVRTGSPEDQYQAVIQPIVAKNCVACHGGIAGLPNFTTYAGLKAEAKIDEGASIGSLTRVSHIHLFGISFIFFFICLIFSL